MFVKKWQEVAFSLELEPPLWELFHENSKLDRSSPTLSKGELRQWICQLEETLSFKGFPAVPLPTRLPALNVPLGKAILSRMSVRDLAPNQLKLKDVAALLHFGYGVNRDKAVSDFVRRQRVVPSAGGLYPLEIFLHSSRVKGLTPGLYHYNPSSHSLRFLRKGNHSYEIAKSFVQRSIPKRASLLIFITAMFERSVFKYIDRGYRYVLFEAGHVAQNINLVSTALGLGCVNIGGFFDREIDAFLKLDGAMHSTIYTLGIGMRTERCLTSSKTKRRAYLCRQ
jgi:SagB-type dehydrogenase family enzyme